jgi:hypothetical protein
MNKIVREPAGALPADLRGGLAPKATVRVAIAEEPRPSPDRKSGLLRTLQEARSLPPIGETRLSGSGSSGMSGTIEPNANDLKAVLPS